MKLLACAAALIIGVTLAAPASADPADPPGPPATPTLPTLPDSASDRARAALDRVEDLFTVTPTASTDQRPSLTLALRELSLLKDDLPAPLEAEAERFLARPTDGKRAGCRDVRCYNGKAKRTCSPEICVHWVPKKRDRRNGVRRADRDDDGVPNFVERVRKEMTRVHKTYVGSGYRAPMSDGGRGGNAKPDVYLAQIGDYGYYGYCTSDDPTPPTRPEPGGTWGYCVLDNDYRHKEFPVHTPIENMQVTAAHEYFHNVQFGYDWTEDDWLYEATATWAEDEVHDKINDNAYYLPYGPIRAVGTPLDTFEGLYHYGAWIFFRYLTDQYDDVQGSLHDLVLRIWELADAEQGPDLYSLEAVQQVLSAEGTELGDELAEFAAGNRFPKRTYRQEYREVRRDPDDRIKYPRSPLARTFRLGSENRSARRAFDLDHLTSRTFRLEPAAGPRGQVLRLKLDVNEVEYGGRVVVTLKEKGAPPTTELVTLAPDGTGTWTRPFHPSTVQWAEVTVVNASDRMDCWVRGAYSCRGAAVDDDRRQILRARILPPA